MAFKYSKEIKIKAIELYLQGMAASKVSEVIGANESTIRYWLKVEGINIKNGGTYNSIYSSNVVEKIYELYNEGYSTVEIEKMLALKRGIASYLLRKNGYVLRHRGPKSMIQYENYFDVIDNEKKAYFLGWLMADGNISIKDGQYSLKMHIALKDRVMIDRFLKEISSKNKTSIKNTVNPSYYVSLTSIHMCKSLMELGIMPRKSGKEIFPKQIPKDLYHHFIRGVFDGDGITDIKRKRSGFVGSYNIVQNILEVIEETNITVFNNKKNKDIYYFLGGKKFSRKLYEFLYKDANIWLERKRLRMKEICF